jgi:hypothetical protein
VPGELEEQQIDAYLAFIEDREIEQRPLLRVAWLVQQALEDQEEATVSIREAQRSLEILIDSVR